MSNGIVSSILLALNAKAKIAIIVVCALILLWMIIVIVHLARKKKREQPEAQAAPALPVKEEEPEAPKEEAPTYVEDIPEEFPEETPEEEEELSLSESLAEAKDFGASGIVTKESIIDHLASMFGDQVELNGRANRTPNGKLLLSDNHFAFSQDGKRVCFTYVYQDDDGDVIILLRTTAEHAHEIHLAHKHTGVRSAFPKNKERDWYSVVVDDTFTADAVYDILDKAVWNIIGHVAPVEEEPEDISLSESLAEAKDFGASGIVTKKSIIDHLAAKFGDKVELNGRENRTPNGKLLLSDNHFAVSPKGKKVCFAYVYEDDDGDVIILLRTTAAHAQDIHTEHDGTGFRSAFPKNKERDWYSVVVDDTFSEEDVYEALDRAAINIIGEPAPEKAPEHEYTLSESLAAAHESGKVGVVTKKSIIEDLSAKYGDKVELNGRENRTPNGKLLMSDTHFALADGKRVCFTYVYEDEGKVMMLIRLSEKEAQEVHAAHSHTCFKSAFPKNKEKDWYSVVVDGSFTGAVVYEVLDKAYAYVLTK
ncbi:MAG: hypothetical protein J5774_01715 [Clostridia bacterium]|nr:hypothetical protein [Clostridia bacterium]